MKNKIPLTINITPGTVVLIIFFVTIAWLLYQVRSLIPIVLVALIFSAALAPGKEFLNKKLRIPIPISVTLLYLLAFLIFSFLIYSLVPIVVAQYNLFIESVPILIDKVRVFFEGTPLEEIIIPAFSGSDKIPELLGSAFSFTGSGLLSVFNGIIDLVLFLILTFLFSVKPESIDDFFHTIAPKSHKKYVVNLWNRTQVKMGQWFQGQLLLVVIIGVLTYFPLLILQVPNALFLASFAGIMELIPIFGPVLGAIPAILMALTLGDTTTVLIVIALFVLLQQLENNLIYPLVVTKVVGVSPILVILAVVVGGSLAGIIGIIIAVPLAGGLQLLFSDIKSGRLAAVEE